MPQLNNSERPSEAAVVGTACDLHGCHCACTSKCTIDYEGYQYLGNTLSAGDTTGATVQDLKEGIGSSRRLLWNRNSIYVFFEITCCQVCYTLGSLAKKSQIVWSNYPRGGKVEVTSSKGYTLWLWLPGWRPWNYATHVDHTNAP